MSHQAYVMKPYQVTRYYAKIINKLANEKISPKLETKITIAYKLNDIFTLRNLYTLYGDKIIKYLVCLAIAISRSFDVAKMFLKYKLDKVPKYEIFDENISVKYDIHIRNIDVSDESDYYYWSKLFENNSLVTKFKTIFKIQYFELEEKPRSNNFELAQLEYLHIPFKEVEDRYKAKIMLKNCIYLLASEMMTEKNISKNVIVDFKKQKLCVEDLKFQANFINSVRKLNKDGQDKAKKFIAKFKETATDRQIYLLDKFCKKVFDDEKQN